MPRTKHATAAEPSASRAAAPALTSRLHELISACFTGIWITTAEPTEATRDLTPLSRS